MKFGFDVVLLGDYACEVSTHGFDSMRQMITVTSGGAPILHFSLALTGLFVKVTVRTSWESVAAQASTLDALIRRKEIARASGEDRTNSLAMISDFVRGAYLTAIHSTCAVGASSPGP